MGLYGSQIIYLFKSRLPGTMKTKKPQKLLILIETFLLVKTKPGQLCYGCIETTLFQKLNIPAFTSTVETSNKITDTHMSWGDEQCMCQIRTD